jgi:hypothetical protein
MGNYIGEKKVWVSTNGWSGYEKPENSVGCCNCTGDWSDSPCPTSVVKSEIEGFKTILKKHGIRHKKVVTKSSNVFMVKVHILVHPNDRERGLELSREYQRKQGVRLFYTED